MEQPGWLPEVAWNDSYIVTSAPSLAEKVCERLQALQYWYCQRPVLTNRPISAGWEERQEKACKQK
jgi:hypothetical protein